MKCLPFAGFCLFLILKTIFKNVQQIQKIKNKKSIDKWLFPAERSDLREECQVRTFLKINTSLVVAYSLKYHQASLYNPENWLYTGLLLKNVLSFFSEMSIQPSPHNLSPFWENWWGLTTIDKDKTHPNTIKICNLTSKRKANLWLRVCTDRTTCKVDGGFGQVDLGNNIRPTEMEHKK